MTPKNSSEFPFSQLVETFEALDATTSGNEMIEILSGFFQRVDEDVIDIASYFIQGNLAAEHADLNLFIGDKLIAEAIARAADRTKSDIETLYHERGDYGLVAQDVLEGRMEISDPLTIEAVHARFLEVAEASGEGSQDAKINLIAEILGRAKPQEAKYIIKIGLGVLRLGAGTMTILNSLAVAFTEEKKNKKHLERAYNLCGDVGRVAKVLAEGGLEALDEIQVEVGHPIKVMAAQRVKKLGDLFEKMPEGLAAEFKYDGERLQCHKRGTEVEIFSRNMERITGQYPDVVQKLVKQIRADEAIVEGEAVALVQGTTDQFREFQILMRRKRKHDIEKFIEEVPVKLFLFDVLYVDGESVMEKSYPESRQILESIVDASPTFEPAHALFSENPEEIESFFLESIEKGFEGIMAKSCAPTSRYRAGAREWSWIKWKRDYESDLVDTFDVVVVGGIAGRGKRSGTWGALLCAVYNPDQDRFETLCKVSTGFKDEELEKLPEMFKKNELEHISPRVLSKMEPTRWFDPRVVLEISGAELTKSPIHTCAINEDDENSTGIALRFPRFLRFRDDKDADQATTSAEIKSLFEK